MYGGRSSTKIAARRSEHERRHECDLRESAEQAKALSRAVAALSPQGRAKRKAVNSWAEMVKQRATQRRALSALTRRSERAGFNAWAAAIRGRYKQLAVMSRAAAC